MAAKTSGDTPRIDLNLDTLEYEGDSTPYGFVLKGRRYELPCAQLVDVTTLNMLARDPALFFAEVMTSEDYSAFSEVKLPFHALKRLANDYTARYGLGN